MSPAGIVVIDVRPDRLLLHAADEPDPGAPPAWPVGPGPVVVCTPAVSQRPDVFPVLRAILPERLGGCAVPVRLLLTGAGSTGRWSEQLRMLSTDLGMAVVLEPAEASTADAPPTTTVDTEIERPTPRTDADRPVPPGLPVAGGPPAIGAVSLLAPRQWNQLGGVALSPAIIPGPVIPDPVVPDPVIPDSVMPEPLSPVDPPVAGRGAPTGDGVAANDDAMAGDGAAVGEGTARGERARAGEPPPAAAPVRSVAAMMLDPADLADDEWPTLRSRLNGGYDAHARVITRALSEQPGLRGAGNQPAGGLIAVRALCSEQSEASRRVLRRATDDGGRDEIERIAFVARAARQGLRRLPTVLGPVFRPANVAPDHLAAYRAGMELVEPAFLDADLAPSRPAGTTVMFAIWSFNGRRVDVLAPADARPVLFPPASVFCVLAVDRPEGEPARVLLKERGFGDADEHIVAGLRAAVDALIIDSPRLDDLAIGLHDGMAFQPGT
jgi:hypothetical protein